MLFSCYSLVHVVKLLFTCLLLEFKQINLHVGLQLVSFIEMKITFLFHMLVGEVLEATGAKLAPANPENLVDNERILKR